MTAVELIWKCVSHARWKGIYPQDHGGAGSFIGSLLSVYLDTRVYYVSRISKSTLRIQVAGVDVDNFRNKFPDAERDPNYGASHQGLVMLRLPIPVEYRSL